MKPVFTGREEIMKFYDSVNPDGDLAYSVWFGDNVMVQCPGDVNPEKCRELLALNCDAWEKSGFEKTLLLRFHPAQRDPITRKTPVLIAQPIGFGDSEEEEVISGRNGVTALRNGNGMNLEMYKAIAGLGDLPKTIGEVVDTKLSAYDERLKALEQPAKEEPTLSAQIGAFISQNPSVVGEVLSFLKGILPSMQQPLQPTGPMAINGPPKTMEEQTLPSQNNAMVAEQKPELSEEQYNQKIDQALDRLESKMHLADDLTLLADFSDREPEQFKFLLNMLRTQK